METVWFALVALMLTGYVVLDGFDLGTGALHLILGRTTEERDQILDSIGPFWDGNEVWLVAGGGTLYFAFPALYASAFSGFYLPLMIVLWLLLLRGIAIEMRHQMRDSMWLSFWDVVFCGASALLAIFFGAALGNVIRGVPLDKDGVFFLALWTDFRVTGNPGILDWYTLLVAATAFAGLLLHGAWWIAYKVHLPLEQRATALANRLWWAATGLTVAVSAASFWVRPGLLGNFSAMPWGVVFPFAAAGGLWQARRSKGTLASFTGSSVYLTGMMASAAFSLYPCVLPASIGIPGPDRSLTVFNAAAPGYGLGIGLIWWLPALLLALGYAAFVYHRFSGKVDRRTEP